MVVSAPSRRRLLGGTAAAAAGGLLAGFGSAAALAGQAQAAPAAPATERYLPFHGARQSGILDPAPAHAVFAGWNLEWGTGNRRDQLRNMLRMISGDAARLMSGQGVLADTEPELAQPPSELTLTVALGQRLLEVIGTGRVGSMPAFAGDRLQERYGQNDLLIQFCGQDPTVLQHAVRAVSKNLRPLARRSALQVGFRQSPGSTGAFRNLFGQLDGINNPAGQALEQAVFGTAEQPSWVEHGTTLALRRFELDLDAWDELSRAGRDYALGRRQLDGSPLSGTRVEDPVRLDAVDELGLPRIAPTAHVALARAASGDEVIHRRGYNFADGSAAGLIFAAYQRDPQGSFIRVQHRLAAADALNQWLTPVGSALYAVLPGAQPGGYLGQQLLE